MFNSIWFYIILGLSLSTVSLGWLSLHNYTGRVEAESSLVAAINANTDLQKSLNLKDLSCKIDDKSVVELQAINVTTQEVVDDISTQLQSHASVKKPPVNAVQSSVQLPSKEKSNNEITYLPDDGLLSPTITGLLHKSFCNAEPTDATCISTR